MAKLKKQLGGDKPTFKKGSKSGKVKKDKKKKQKKPNSLQKINSKNVKGSVQSQRSNFKSPNKKSGGSEGKGNEQSKTFKNNNKNKWKKKNTKEDDEASDFEEVTEDLNKLYDRTEKVCLHITLLIHLFIIVHI